MKTRILSLLLAGALLVGCAAPMMRLDAEFARAADYLPASGRQGWLIRQQIGFGDFTTNIIDRDWDSTGSVEILGVSNQQRRSGYRFSLSRQQQSIASVDCRSGGDAAHIDIKGVLGGDAQWIFEAEDFLSCTILPWGQAQNWQLELYQQLGDHSLRGYFYRAGSVVAPYEILGSVAHGSAWTPGEQVGFLIFDRGVQVAAVQSSGQGGVWLERSLNAADQGQLAALAAALLAYQPVESTETDSH